MALDEESAGLLLDEELSSKKLLEELEEVVGLSLEKTLSMLSKTPVLSSFSILIEGRLDTGSSSLQAAHKKVGLTKQNAKMSAVTDFFFFIFFSLSVDLVALKRATDHCNAFYTRSQ